MTGRAAMDLTFGATLLSEGGTRFRFWAPAESAVFLAIPGQAPLAMRREADGWFVVEAPCGAGTPYRYRLGDGSEVPDPAARAQLRDSDSPSLVVDPKAYAWRTQDWKGRPWHEAVLYELHVGLLGGFRGVMEALPALRDLGITAVELMPVAEFPGDRNWGYDGVLPYAPEASYGSPEDLKALVDRAHELGLVLFLDVVYNHFGPDGNWLGHYAPDFFRGDLDTPWGTAIDFRRPEVQRFFTENALYWLNEYRFDGLRLDAVHAIQPTAWLKELAREVRAHVEPERLVHLVLENDENQAQLLTAGFDAQWNDDYHHILHVALTGETAGYYADYARETLGLLARALGEGFAYQGQESRHRGGRPRGEASAALPPTAFVNFLQNHDQVGNRALGERLILLTEPAALRAAVALQLLAPQIPLIFMGEEQGSRQPFLYFTSHNETLGAIVRDGRRREFAAFPQFSDPATRDSIPDPNAPATFERSRLGQPDMEAEAWLALYRHLLHLRRDLIMPRLSEARSLGAQALDEAAIIACWRLGDGARLTLLSNLSPRRVAAPPVPAGQPFYASEIWPREVVPPWSTFAWLEIAA